MNSQLDSCKFVQAQLRSLNSTYTRAHKVTAALIKTRLDTEELLEQSLNGFVNALSMQAAKHTSDLAQLEQTIILPLKTSGKNTSIIPSSDWKTFTVLHFNNSQRSESVTHHKAQQSNRKVQSSVSLKYGSHIMPKIKQIHFKRKWMHEQRQKYDAFLMNLNKQTFNLSQFPHQKKQTAIVSREQSIIKPSFDLSYLHTIYHIANSIEIFPSSTFQVFPLIFEQLKHGQSSPRFLNLNLFNPSPINNPQQCNTPNNLQLKAIITKFLGKLAMAAQIQQSIIENEQQLDSQQLHQTNEQFQLEEFKCNGKSIQHRVIQQALNTCLRFSNNQNTPKDFQEKKISKPNDYYHLISENILLSLGLGSNKNAPSADKDQETQSQHLSTNDNRKNNYFSHIFQFTPEARSDSNYDLLDCQQSLKQRYYKLVKLRLFSLENSSSETFTTKRILSHASEIKHKGTVYSTLNTIEKQQNNYSPSYLSSPEATTSSNNRKQLKQHKIDTYFKPPSENQHFPSLDNQFPAYIVKDYSIPYSDRQSKEQIQQNNEQNSQLTFSDLPQDCYFQEPDKQNNNIMITKEQVEMRNLIDRSSHIDLMKDRVNNQQYANNNLDQITKQQEIQNINNSLNFSLKKQSTKQQSLPNNASIFSKLDGYKFNGDTFNLNNLHGNTIKMDKLDKFKMNINSNFRKNINSLVTANNHQIHHLKQRQSLFEKVKARTQASILRDSNIQRDLFSRNTASELDYYNNKNYERYVSNEEQNSSKRIQKSIDSNEYLNLNSSSKSPNTQVNNRTTGQVTPSRRQVDEEDFKLTRDYSNNTNEQIKVNKKANKNQQNKQENKREYYFYGQHHNTFDENEATTEHSREINMVLSQFLTSKD